MNALTVVGCGTVVPEAEHGASCYHLELDGASLLLDCGPGALQGLVRADVPWPEITDLAITHFHADHIGALPGLFFAFRHGMDGPRERPLAVWGPIGTRSLFERMADAFGAFVLDPGFPVEIHELAPDGEARLAEGVRIRAFPTPHTDESLAFRVEGSGGTVGYTGDTGPSEALGPFMAGASVLLCECSLADDEVGDNHLSPGRAAAIARAARPDLLLLTHVYPHLRRRADVAALVARAGYRGETRVARAGLRVKLTSRSAPEEV